MRFALTLEQLEQRVASLEQQVAVLQRQAYSLSPKADVRSTFGMFAADEDFDEIIEQGKQYRQRANVAD